MQSRGDPEGRRPYCLPEGGEELRRTGGKAALGEGI